MAGSDSGQRLVFYREVAVDSFSLVVKRFFTTFFGWRCPACARSSVSGPWLSVRSQCDYCGSRFRRLEGNELVNLALNFFLASVVTFLVGLALILRYGFFPGVTWVLLGVGLATVFIGLKPMRAFALFLLWVIGFVYSDWVGKGKTETTYEEAAARAVRGP